MISYSLFDIVGPIMHGPSSNHTGGAVRLGYYYREIMGSLPENITFLFHPSLLKFYKGHRTHLALMAGCLGMREDHPDVNNSDKIMDEKNIKIKYSPTEEKDPDRNLMEIVATTEGICWDIHGISVGGGNILIDKINGIETDITGNSYVYLYILEKCIDLNKVKEIFPVEDINGGEIPEGYLLYFSSVEQLNGSLPEELTGRVLLKRTLEPLSPFSEKIDRAPILKTFRELSQLCENEDISEVAINYEKDRSKTSREQILNYAKKIVLVERDAIDHGLQGDLNLIGGFVNSSDAETMQKWSNSGNTIVGAEFVKAAAKALAVSEVNACGGMITAVPTCGSSGTLPAILFTAAESKKKGPEDLAKAFLVAALLGTIVANKSTLSGSVGGCQVEIGVGAAMGAGAAAWLSGGGYTQIENAFSLTLKNILGWTCDPPVGPVEIPCIKRNAIGTAIGLMGAELGLAGIKSAILADQVVDALVDTANRLPYELRCSGIGGLASVEIAKELQKSWDKKIENSNSH